MEVLANQLTYEEQRLIYDELAKTTISHIDRNSGLLEKLEFDPVQNPSQNLTIVEMPAVPTTPKEADELATIADGRLYTYIRDELLSQGALMGILRKKRSEQNVFAVTTHQKMPDVVMQQAATSVAEHQLFGTPWYEIISTNGLIISRGVSTLQAFGMAASEVVQKAGKTFLSFPRTETMKRVMEEIKLTGDVKFDDLVDDNNERMRKEIMEWLPAGYSNLTDIVTIHPSPKKRTFIAWEGTTSGVVGNDPFNPDSVTMERANYGILSVIKHGIILPSVIWDRGTEKEPIFITGELTKVKRTSDVDAIQEWQRATLARSLGIPDDKITIRR